MTNVSKDIVPQNLGEEDEGESKEQLKLTPRKIYVHDQGTCQAMVLDCLHCITCPSLSVHLIYILDDAKVLGSLYSLS
jgi:ferredoxin-like protein FixX